MRTSSKLAAPFFLCSVLLLLLNDWYLKYSYHNWFTGKLSDFAGLFAFPFFLGVLFPPHAKKLYVITAFFFVVWKTPFMQPFIDLLNNSGLPTHRTVDYSDYIALIALPVSFNIYNRSVGYALKPVFVCTLSAFCIVSFVATSMPKGKSTNFFYTDKVYDFNLSKQVLVSRLNAIQLEYVHDMESYSGGRVDFDSKSNTFYYRWDKDHTDTVAVWLDYKEVKDSDTIKLKTSYARFNISGNDKTSQLKLLSLKNYVRDSNKTNGKDDPLKFFEKAVIKEIRDYK